MYATAKCCILFSMFLLCSGSCTQKGVKFSCKGHVYKAEVLSARPSTTRLVFVGVSGCQDLSTVDLLALFPKVTQIFIIGATQQGLEDLNKNFAPLICLHPSTDPTNLARCTRTSTALTSNKSTSTVSWSTSSSKWTNTSPTKSMTSADSSFTSTTITKSASTKTPKPKPIITTENELTTKSSTTFSSTPKRTEPPNPSTTIDVWSSRTSGISSTTSTVMTPSTDHPPTTGTMPGSLPNTTPPNKTPTSSTSMSPSLSVTNLLTTSMVSHQNDYDADDVSAEVRYGLIGAATTLFGVGCIGVAIYVLRRGYIRRREAENRRSLSPITLDELALQYRAIDDGGSDVMYSTSTRSRPHLPPYSWPSDSTMSSDMTSVTGHYNLNHEAVMPGSYRRVGIPTFETFV